MVALDWNADSRLAASRRLIVKIGSALLVDELSGEIRTRWLTGLAADVAGLRDRGAEIVIVSSGAIAVGRTRPQPAGRRPCAGTEAGGSGDRPDPSRACLAGSAWHSRHDGRADP